MARGTTGGKTKEDRNHGDFIGKGVNLTFMNEISQKNAQ